MPSSYQDCSFSQGAFPRRGEATSRLTAASNLITSATPILVSGHYLHQSMPLRFPHSRNHADHRTTRRGSCSSWHGTSLASSCWRWEQPPRDSSLLQQVRCTLPAGVRQTNKGACSKNVRGLHWFLTLRKPDLLVASESTTRCVAIAQRTELPSFRRHHYYRSSDRNN